MNPPSSVLRRTSRVSGAMLLAFSQAVLLGLGYITHPLIGKLGGPALYGVFGVVLSLQTILNMILSLGIPTAIAKEVAEDEGNSGAILWAAVKGQALLAALLSMSTVVFAPFLANLFGDPALTPIIRFTAVIYPFTGLYAILSNYFSGLHAFLIQASLIILYAVIKLGGSLGLLFPFGVRGALAGFGVGGLVAGIVGITMAIPTVRGKFRSPVPIRRLVQFGGAFVGTSIALQLLMSMDLFLVKRLLHDDVVAGQYNAAVTLARIPYFILQALGFVFLPSVARLMREDVERGRTFIRDISRYLFLLLLPVTAIAATTSKNLLFLFFSRAYLPAAPALTLLMVALGLLSMFYLFSTIAAGANKPRVPFIISALLIPLSMVNGMMLIPRFGMQGAALTTIISAAVGAAAIGTYMLRRFRLTFPLHTLVTGIVATVVAVLPTYVVSVPKLLLPLEYLALFGLYVLMLIALGELKRDDLQHLRRLLPKGQKSGSVPADELPSSGE